MLTVDRLSVAFTHQGQRQYVIDELSFCVQQGQCLGLVGESGSGKSLTAAAVMQLLPQGAVVAEHSAVYFDGRDLLSLTEQQMQHIRGGKIAMVFQDALSAFNPVRTIGDQMIEVLRKQGIKKAAVQIASAHEMLDQVGIQDVRRCFSSYPHALSGGMRQRAMIAMALCAKPTLLIADEPTTAQDMTIQAQILDLLMELKSQHNMAILFITHDLGVVAQVADQVMVMRHGQKLESQSVDAFFKSPRHVYSQTLLGAVPVNKAPAVVPPGSEPLLSIKSLSVVYAQSGAGWFSRSFLRAVDRVSFSVHRGETLALVGESGSGKSTVAKAILRLLDIETGSVKFDGRHLASLSRKQLFELRATFQIIFQDPFAALNPRRTVEDSLKEGLVALKAVRDPLQQAERIDQMLQKVGLPPACKTRYPHQFSGGERQRICIARALLVQPKMLILDEPTSALDVSIQRQILELLLALQQEFNMTYLLITHDFGVVRSFSDVTAVLKAGQLVEMGPTQSVLKHPQQLYTQRLLAAVPALHLVDSVE